MVSMVEQGPRNHTTVKSFEALIPFFIRFPPFPSREFQVCGWDGPKHAAGQHLMSASEQPLR